MIVVSHAGKTGEPDELIFINPQHIVWVTADPQDKDGGAIIALVTQRAIHVTEGRDEIVQMIEENHA